MDAYLQVLGLASVSRCGTRLVDVLFQKRTAGGVTVLD